MLLFYTSWEVYTKFGTVSGGEAFRALPLYEQFLFAQREPERARRYLAE